MSDTKHTPGFQRWSPIHEGLGMWTHGEGSYYKASEVDAELTKVKAERDALARYILEDLRGYVQEVTDDHIQKFGLNYRPERIKYYQDELAKIDRIKEGKS